MLKARFIEKMTAFYNGNIHDTEHFLKVYGYAQTIGYLEDIDEEKQDILEIAAIVHDIACPLCREKYGIASGEYQEKESEPLLREFFSEFELEEKILERVIYLVCHHHTYSNVDGIDYQILLEADFLVNAAECTENVQSFRERVFKTESGLRLLDNIYGTK